jgi:predicted transcriptional regulator
MMLEQKSRWMQGSFKILIENGSKVVAQHLNNDVGTLVYYTGVAPQYVTPPAIDASNREWIDSLIQKGFMQEGVSQLSAAAQKPLGVDSGKAMRTLTDIEDDRFTFVSQQMEEFVLENIRQAIDVVKEIYKDKKTYEVVFPQTNFLETVDWKDINVEEDAYVLKAYPTSSLADDISGRLSDIQELAQAGMISPRTARRLMNMPDVEMNDNLSNAAEDLLHKVLEKMIYDEEFTAPLPFWDLQLAQQLTLEYYNYCQFMNAPQEVMKLLEDFNAALADLTGQVQQGLAGQQALATIQAAQQQAAQQPPPANPTATPTSNMIPNVNTGGTQ